MICAYTDKHKECLYALFRIIVGLLFFQHGISKLGGLTGGEIGMLMGVVGVIELVGGLAITFGFFTRLAAFGLAIIMVVAYFKVHAAMGLLPIDNKGELAVLYFACFLTILGNGSGKWSLEKVIFKKEVF